MPQVNWNGPGARRLLSVGIASVGLACFASPAAAATLTPTTFDDGGNGVCADGSCTLRDAIRSAATGDTIKLSAGEYLVTNATRAEGMAGQDPEVADLDTQVKLTIEGAGQGSTRIRSTGNFRVLESYRDLTVRDLTITGGRQTDRGGGGISQQAEELKLSRVAITGNFAIRGGGIFSAGTRMELNDVTVSDNVAQGTTSQSGGGGIAAISNGRDTFTNVTVSDNEVTSENGAGIYYAEGRVMSGTNVTIAGNDAKGANGGGLYVQNGTRSGTSVSLTNATITGNTGDLGDGIFNAAGRNAVDLKNSILENDGGDNCASADGLAPVISSRGGNLARGTTCQLEAANNRNAVTSNNLGVLGTYGLADRVKTVNLRRGSSALGFGTGCPATDARNVTRATPCDSGAHEQERVKLAMTTTESADPVTAGDVLTYTVTATNAADSLIPISKLKLNTGTAAEATFIDATSDAGTCTSTNGGESIACSLGTLNPGASLTLTMRVRIKAGGSITTRFALNGDEPGASSSSDITTVINERPTARAADPPVTPAMTRPATPGVTPPAAAAPAVGSVGVKPPVVAPPVDRAPAVTVRRSSLSKRVAIPLKRISLLATTDEASTVSFTLKLAGRTVGSATVRYSKAGEKRVTLRLSTAGARALRAAKATARLSLTTRATDTTGNRSTKTGPVRLTR